MSLEKAVKHVKKAIAALEKIDRDNIKEVLQVAQGHLWDVWCTPKFGPVA